MGDDAEVLRQPLPDGVELLARIALPANGANDVEFSPDGRYIGVSALNTVAIWAVGGDQPARTVIPSADRPMWPHRTGERDFYSFGWLPDGHRIMVADEFRIGVLDLDRREEIWGQDQRRLEGAAVSPGGEKIAVSRRSTVLILRADNGRTLHRLDDHAGGLHEFAWSPDGRFLASSSGDPSDPEIRIWDMESGELRTRLTGHYGYSGGLAWSPRDDLLVSASQDKSVRLWDPLAGQLISVIEVHTDETRGVSFSPDGGIFVSASLDGSVRFWSADDRRELAALQLSETSDRLFRRMSFTTDGSHFALARLDELLVFRTDLATIARSSTALDTVRYTTAKLVLVGDSGVGKTGLGWRLSHDEFQEHESTHGQQFWVVNSLGVTRPDGTECEAVIWDLAGQHVYRPIHVIFLEHVDLAILLFDPTNRHETLKGVDFWLEQLAGRGELPPTVLVGGRQDRGTSVLAQADLAELCRQRGIAGGYIATSAKTGEGVDELLGVLRDLIPWDRAAATVTTVTFKRIKDYVLALKERATTGPVLVDFERLFGDLAASDPLWQFTADEMRAAVGHLENHGFVAVLRSSAGLELVLLVPSLLPDLASSIVLLADRHPRELGAVDESALLTGEYPFAELTALDPDEREVLIDATVVRFLRHNVCFRETLGAETVLIFPSLIRQRRPLQDDAETVDDVSYVAHGRVENSYAALAVLLGYSQFFTRVTQWQNQTLFELDRGQICGLRVIQEREGELEFVLSYSTGTPDHGRQLFQALFEKFLVQRDVDVARFTPVCCGAGHRQDRTVVVQRRRERRGFLFCSECGEKVPLPDADVVGRPAAAGVLGDVARQEGYARLRSEYEANLARIKAYARSAAAPRCYLSHAGDQVRWVERVRHSLRDAGVDLLDDLEDLRDDDTVLMICTPAYWSAWPTGLAARLRRGSPAPVIALLVEGRPTGDQRARLGGREVRDFRDGSRHFLQLFDLVLTLHGIHLDHPAFVPLRREMAERWREALRTLPEPPPPITPAREVYVSYAWNDESKPVVTGLDQALREQGVRMIRDTEDLGYRGDIREFMREIGRGRAVVLVISDKYLRSENCMFELLEVARHGDLRERIFPVVLDSARIYKPVDRLKYVRFWEEQTAELDAAMKTVSSANLHGFREEIDLFEAIRAALPRLGDILKNINTLSPAAHRESGYAELVAAVLRTVNG
ncbi:TIR domain-containing protein [Paractinoplanes toevensis]|uniref:TIR domain-containing protein n=1 Tax=Paractinoplanes toevensis TaxID=571911 RepID=A0A919TB82_9ACTN|nr:TIR domain-containing protein [Actinoplanes toevensis]GIM92218.1 hypothetical protein Ato02nite_040110 [Actinoplanes toevensis]